MFSNQSLSRLLEDLQGLAADAPRTAAFSAADGIDVNIDFTAVDRLACAFRELRVSGPAIAGVPFATLSKWADQLCQRVTYLLEQVGPLEHDAAAETVLIRSTPPARQAEKTTFYEIVLHAPDTLTLRRYRRITRDANREQIDLQMTHEVLEKLTTDLVATLPA